MVKEDTIRLLRECDAGIKMGISAIDDVLPDVTALEFKKELRKNRTKHEHLQDEIDKLLDKYGDEGKDPNMMARSMSWMKTNVKMMADPSDATIADVMTDGCNMGVKSLNRYLNQYKAADEFSKDITKRLINLEKDLSDEMQCYL